MTTTTITIIDRQRVEQINQEHRLCVRSYEDALAHAVECGRQLAAVRAEMPHGEWLPWLAEHFDGSVRIAQRYMQLAAAPQLQNASETTHLTIEAALKQIARPQPAAKPAQAGDVGAALQSLAGRDPDGATHIQRERLDEARDRLRAQHQRAWSEQQERRRQRVLDWLQEIRGTVEDAHAPGLAAFAVAEQLRHAAATTRHAAAALDELAFSFER